MTDTDEAMACAVAHVDALRQRSLRLLEDLVLLNSHTANVRGVDAVGDRLAAALHLPTLEARALRPAQGAAHWVFRTRAAEATPPWLLIGHHDTVFPPGTFEGYRVDGELAHGPGVLDMKGGLVVVALALWALHEAGLLAHIPLQFVSVADEETGSGSAQALLRELAGDARGALVFEAGRAHDAIITSRRGSAHVIVEAHGRSAHAGNALAEGVNAIWALACFIDAAQRITEPARGISVNVGLVRGGTSKNTVPDRASCEVDVRFADERGRADAMNALTHAIVTAEQHVRGARLTTTTRTARAPWSETAASRALATSYALQQRAAGLDAKVGLSVGGGSDANTVGALGIPTIDGLGPRGRGFHTTEEQIVTASVATKAEALVRFLIASRDDPR